MKQLDPKTIWLFFIGNIITYTCYAVLLSVIFNFFSDKLVTLTEVEGYSYNIHFTNIAIIFVIIVVASYVLARLNFHFYRYELTSFVFKKERGIIRKKYVSIPLDRIQNVDIERGILARILGLSDLYIQTAGDAGLNGGAISEGRLPGLSKEEAEKLRDELIHVSRQSRSGQGL